MPGRDIIVIGGSAGSFEPLVELVSGLPRELPAGLLVVVHSSPDSAGVLPQLLQRRTPLAVQHAREREPLRHGRVYVATPDHHLLVKAGYMRVVQGPRENGFRPAVDPLFRTASTAYGPRVIGLILSGALDDGTYGLMRIRQAGGVALVQHPEQALVPAMPLSAIRNVDVSDVLRIEQIAPKLIELT